MNGPGNVDSLLISSSLLLLLVNRSGYKNGACSLVIFMIFNDEIMVDSISFQSVSMCYEKNCAGFTAEHGGYMVDVAIYQ